MITLFKRNVSQLCTAINLIEEATGISAGVNVMIIHKNLSMLKVPQTLNLKQNR